VWSETLRLFFQNLPCGQGAQPSFSFCYLSHFEGSRRHFESTWPVLIQHDQFWINMTSYQHDFESTWPVINMTSWVFDFEFWEWHFQAGRGDKLRFSLRNFGTHPFSCGKQPVLVNISGTFYHWDVEQHSFLLQSRQGRDLRSKVNVSLQKSTSHFESQRLTSKSTPN